MAIVLIERARHLNGETRWRSGSDKDARLLAQSEVLGSSPAGPMESDKELRLMVGVPGAIATLPRKRANRTGSEPSKNSVGNLRAYGVPA